jgi:hypothetical protein
MQKLLLQYRDNMRVEVETGIAVTAKNRGGSSRANRLAGRFGLKHPLYWLRVARPFSRNSNTGDLSAVDDRSEPDN